MYDLIKGIQNKKVKKMEKIIHGFDWIQFANFIQTIQLKEINDRSVVANFHFCKEHHVWTGKEKEIYISIYIYVYVWIVKLVSWGRSHVADFIQYFFKI